MTPHLVVMRDAEYEGTNLNEFWVLQSCHWNSGDAAFESPVVQLYLAPHTGTRDVTRAGIPPQSEAIRESCSWDEVPEEVRDQFRQQAQNLSDALGVFGTPTDDDHEDTEDGDEGLAQKYVVREDTEDKDLVTDCFVLEPGDDPAAREAIRTYAAETDNDALEADLETWMDEIEDS